MMTVVKQNRAALERELHSQAWQHMVGMPPADKLRTTMYVLQHIDDLLPPEQSKLSEHFSRSLASYIAELEKQAAK